jgi:small-conductance mechanosensitive channel
MMNNIQNSDLRFVAKGMKAPVSPGGFKRWVTTLSAIAISICCAMLSLRCLQLFSDNSIKPTIGCSIYFFSALVLFLYFLVQRKFEMKPQIDLFTEPRYILINMETLSESILRWMISIFAALFLLLNIATAIVCIYNLPDRSTRPLPGSIFLLISLIFICCLLIKLGKERSQYRKRHNNFVGDTLKEKPIEESVLRLSGAFRQWMVLLSTTIVSFSGVCAAYFCLFTLPDQTSRPFTGSLFYFCSALLLITFFVLQWNGEKIGLPDTRNIESRKIIIKDYFSEKIIKWVMALYAAIFTLLSIAAAILCLFFGLPDKSVRPDAAVIFLFSGLSAISILTFALWRNKPAPKRSFG